jgi:hypothetical protein
MSTEAMLDQIVTQTYVNLMMKTCKEFNPDFLPEKGEITYDFEKECYLFSGFTDEEMKMLQMVIEFLNTGKAA